MSHELRQIKAKNLLISPSPCQFGRGWASSRCQSAIWSPLLADSCKATHVRVTRTRWCCEGRGTERVSALDCPVKSRIPLPSKHNNEPFISRPVLTLPCKISVTTAINHQTQRFWSGFTLMYSCKNLHFVDEFIECHVLKTYYILRLKKQHSFNDCSYKNSIQHLPCANNRLFSFSSCTSSLSSIKIALCQE